MRSQVINGLDELRESGPLGHKVARARKKNMPGLGCLRQSGLQRPGAVLRYLGRYTHRVAISNHRIVAQEGDRVKFRWKDYAHGKRQRLMTLSAEEFLRRFVQQVLPRGFVRIRQFGFLANGCRNTLITVSRQLLAFSPDVRAPSIELPTKVVWNCPRCGAPMHIQQKLSAFQLEGRCGFIDTS